MTTDTVLVTGAFGLVGSAVVKRLVDEGRNVVATDLGLPGNLRKARRLATSDRVEVHWVDLTDPDAAEALVASVDPRAIVHLAAVIPPACYAHRTLARRVNVDATHGLIRAASKQPVPPRFVQASSVAVYGARNPHLDSSLLTPRTPVAPCDLYGAHKVEVEQAVMSSDLDWVILRLGGVLTPVPRWDAGTDLLHFEALLPADGRLQTVDVRDVARAFVAATATDATKEIFLVGGDESHRVLQGAIGPAIAEAMGLVGALSPGMPGDPDNERDWFATDWMDTTRAQEVLQFQTRSLPDMFAESRVQVGWRRWPLRAAVPIIRVYLRAKSPYRHSPRIHADPWEAILHKWGDPSPDDAPGGVVPGVMTDAQ